jgi:rubredoxin-NAD+ reductase
MQPIIIVGAGLAGYTLAREFRKLDKTTPLMLITADGGGFYSKPMLSNALTLEQEPAQLVTKAASQMAAQLDMQVVTQAPVSEIDVAKKTLQAGERQYEFQKLVIAVGAEPIRLPLTGSAAARVLSVNHVDDYAAFRSQLTACADEGKASVTILGAGLIGCEFANDLANAGCKVTLVDPGPLPLAALTPRAIARGLHEALNALDVEVRLGVTAQSIDEASGGIQVSLSDGATFTTGLVLSAVGLKPSLELAQQAQLETNRGIIVDETGRTSHPDIYALGDCAEYKSGDGVSRLLPYVAPIMNAARAVASTLAGNATAIDLKPMPVLIKTPAYPIAVVPPPIHAKEKGRWVEQREGAQTVCRFYDENDVMAGFGVAPHDMAIRQKLMAELGKRTQAST